jgi:truncated hemoglobin YjbI
MPGRAALLDAMGGEAGCKRLSEEFYGRVAKDKTLRPLFPGKTLKCAIEEFSAFLIQFLGGDEEQTQRRWWLSLRESHARFTIGPTERRAWLKHMGATLDATCMDEPTREALRQFFDCSSAYVVGPDIGRPAHDELEVRWADQRALDAAIAAIAADGEDEAIEAAARFVSRPAVFVGLLARMVRCESARYKAFIVDAVQSDRSLTTRRFGGRTLLHYGSAAGSVAVVSALLRAGADANVRDSGGHSPLYSVANECGSAAGPDVVRALVEAGADVNAAGGVTRATPLHMAARRGHAEIARTLLDCGAAMEARDSKGDTPLQRAVNCRRAGVVRLLIERGAVQGRTS